MKGFEEYDKSTICLPRQHLPQHHAQYIAQHLVTQFGMESNFYIDSAATSREEIGNPVHYGTRRKLEAEGIFCGDHRARQLKKSDYDEFDFLIGMDTQNIRNMYRILGEDPEQKVYKLLDLQNGKEILQTHGTPVTLI